MNRRRWLLLALVIGAIGCAAAQDTGSGAAIRGRILDQLTGAPVENVNIYVAGTTLGAGTSPDGTFLVAKVPAGKCELVVSRVGYERMVVRLTIARAETLSVEYRLSPRTVEIGEVSVTQDRDERWDENLDRFRRAFLGPSPFAADCEILNPEILELSFDHDTLVAVASAPLVIGNAALGYRITIVLDRFIWNVENDYGSYRLYPYFEAMRPGRPGEEEAWNEHRRTAWQGSLRHFLRTLYHGTSESESFFLHTGTLRNVLSGHGHRILSSEFRPDSIAGTPFREFRLVSPLRIEYGLTDADIEAPLRKQAGRRVPGRVDPSDLATVSFLSVPDSVMVIDPDGNLFDPLAVEVAGRWGMSRVAELLPSH